MTGPQAVLLQAAACSAKYRDIPEAYKLVNLCLEKRAENIGSCNPARLGKAKFCVWEAIPACETEKEAPPHWTVLTAGFRHQTANRQSLFSGFALIPPSRRSTTLKSVRSKEVSLGATRAMDRTTPPRLRGAKVDL